MHIEFLMLYFCYLSSDQMHVSDIADILTRYHKEKKVPIIVVEQNLRFARKLGDRFLIMQKGSIVAQGQMDELTDELSKKYMSV